MVNPGRMCEALHAGTSFAILTKNRFGKNCVEAPSPLEVIARCWRPRCTRYEAGRDVGSGPCVVSWSLLAAGVRTVLGMRQGATLAAVRAWSPGRCSLLASALCSV
jgi:hypothetical protein